MTKGEASGDPKIREEECNRASEMMGADGFYLGGMEDTTISDDVRTIRIIEEIINKIKPDIIYTHTYKDTHQDHRNTGYATLSAGRRCKKIFMYESPTTFKEFSPQVFIDISEEFEKKKEIMRVFSSQSNKEWWAIGDKAALAIEGLAAYRGFQAGVEFAEAFEVGRLVLSRKDLMFNNIA